MAITLSKQMDAPMRSHSSIDFPKMSSHCTASLSFDRLTDENASIEHDFLPSSDNTSLSDTQDNDYVPTSAKQDISSADWETKIDQCNDNSLSLDEVSLVRVESLLDPAPALEKTAINVEASVTHPPVLNREEAASTFKYGKAAKPVVGQFSGLHNRDRSSDRSGKMTVPVMPLESLNMTENNPKLRVVPIENHFTSEGRYVLIPPSHYQGSSTSVVQELQHSSVEQTCINTPKLNAFIPQAPVSKTINTKRMRIKQPFPEVGSLQQGEKSEPSVLGESKVEEKQINTKPRGASYQSPSVQLYDGQHFARPRDQETMSMIITHANTHAALTKTNERSPTLQCPVPNNLIIIDSMADELDRVDIVPRQIPEEKENKNSRELIYDPDIIQVDCTQGPHENDLSEGHDVSEQLNKSDEFQIQSDQVDALSLSSKHNNDVGSLAPNSSTFHVPKVSHNLEAIRNSHTKHLQNNESGSVEKDKGTKPNEYQLADPLKSTNKVEQIQKLFGSVQFELEDYEKQKEAVHSQKAEIKELLEQDRVSRSHIKNLQHEILKLSLKCKKLQDFDAKYKLEIKNIVRWEKSLRRDATELRETSKSLAQEGAELVRKIREPEPIFKKLNSALLTAQELGVSAKDLKDLSNINSILKRDLGKVTIELGIARREKQSFERKLDDSDFRHKQLISLLKENKESTIAELTKDDSLLNKIFQSGLMIHSSVENTKMAITSFKDSEIHISTAQVKFVEKSFRSIEIMLSKVLQDEQASTQSQCELMGILKERLDEIKQETIMQDKHISLNNALKEKLSVSESQFSSITTERDSLKTNLCDTRLECGNLQSQLREKSKQLVSTLASHKHEAHIFQNTLQELQCKAKLAEDQLEAAQVELLQSKKDLDQARTHSESVSKHIVDLEAELLVAKEVNETSLNEKNGYIDACLTEKAESQQRFVKAFNEREQEISVRHKAHIKVLDQRLKESEREINSLKEELQNTQAINRGKTAELGKLREEISLKAIPKYHVVQEKLDRALNENEDADSRFDRVQSELAACKDECSKQAIQIQSLEEQASSSTSRSQEFAHYTIMNETLELQRIITKNVQNSDLLSIQSLLKDLRDIQNAVASANDLKLGDEQLVMDICTRDDRLTGLPEPDQYRLELSMKNSLQKLERESCNMVEEPYQDSSLLTEVICSPKTALVRNTMKQSFRTNREINVIRDKSPQLMSDSISYSQVSRIVDSQLPHSGPYFREASVFNTFIEQESSQVQSDDGENSTWPTRPILSSTNGDYTSIKSFSSMPPISGETHSVSPPDINHTAEDIVAGNSSTQLMSNSKGRNKNSSETTNQGCEGYSETTTKSHIENPAIHDSKHETCFISPGTNSEIEGTKVGNQSAIQRVTPVSLSVAEESSRRRESKPLKSALRRREPVIEEISGTTTFEKTAGTTVSDSQSSNRVTRSCTQQTKRVSTRSSYNRVASGRVSSKKLPPKVSPAREISKKDSQHSPAATTSGKNNLKRPSFLIPEETHHDKSPKIRRLSVEPKRHSVAPAKHRVEF